MVSRRVALGVILDRFGMLALVWDSGSGSGLGFDSRFLILGVVFDLLQGFGFSVGFWILAEFWILRMVFDSKRGFRFLSRF